MSSLDQIAHAVLEWQRRHPLALRLGPDAVHSIGLVALPFVRASEAPAAALAQPSWQRLFKRRAQGDQPAFSEAFIEGIAPAAAARFALQQGMESIEGLEDWPQRRVAVDSRLAEAAAGGWPYERWLASAALDGPHGRQRVLVSLRPDGRPAVLGQRHWDRRRLVAAALLPSLALAAWLALRPAAPPPEHPPTATGSVVSAASAASATPAAPDASAAPAPEPVASQPSTSVEAASGPAPASLPGSAPETEATGRPIAPDIRPHLGPQRAEPRPPLNANQTTSASRDPTPSAPAKTADGAADAASGPAPRASQAPLVAAERPSLRALPPGAPPVALVSPGFAKRSDAEAMLARMLEHAGKTLASGSRLEGEIFSSPQGHRAAVWPFASREEAQLINATMVARGWKTRAVDF